LNILLRRARAILVALAALAISAGAVFAARALPAASGPGLERATEASGRIVPVRGGLEEAVTVEAPPEEPEIEEPETGEPETDEPPAEESADAADNHGAAVLEAATGETPDGYRNHGEYVSEVARDNAGQERATEVRGERVKPAKAPKANKRGG
jgi:hypothetical protein